MSRTPRRRPSLEALEDRRLPAAFGIAWPDPGHLTISFAPDGTAVGGAPSTLSATLDAQLPDAVWHLDVLRAFQAWADLANINLTVVSDDGEAFGTPGPLQGNPGVGDIRIAARPLSSDALAVATPFDMLGNWSGGVILNSNDTFSQGGANDLFSVVLHEAGHVFGLDHDPNDLKSAMYPVLSAVRTGPDANDAAAIQALYGVRQGDAFEGAGGNNTPATATPLGFADVAAIAGDFPLSVGNAGSLFGNGPGGSTTWVAAADVSTATDVDVYAVQAPARGGPLAAVLHAEGLSLLTARLTLTDAAGDTLAAAAAAGPLSNDVAVGIPATVPGATYYVSVAGADGSVFDIGAYRLAVGTPVVASLLADPPVPLSSLTAATPKGIGFANAVPLAPVAPGSDARWRYLVHDALTTSTETDDFVVTAPPADAAGPQALLVTLWGTTTGGLAPVVTVFDARHQTVAAQVLRRDASGFALQIPGTLPSARYVLEVSAQSHFSPTAGGYELAATFGTATVPLDTLAAGAVDASRPDDFRTLVVTTAALYYFDLSATEADPTVPDAARMTVFNAAQSPVFGLDAIAGSGSTTGDAFLAPGTYVVRFSAVTRTGGPTPATTYDLRGFTRSDPIGPTPVDPILIPVGTGTVDDTEVWLLEPDPVYTGFLDLTDILSNPWL